MIVDMERHAAIDQIRAILGTNEDLRNYVQFETQYFELPVHSKESFFEQADLLMAVWGLECLPEKIC